jgi:hypothetical protein
VLFRFSPAHRGESAQKKKKMVVVPRQRSLPAVEFFQKKGSSGRPPPLRQTLARGATRAVSARSSVASTAVVIDAGHASALRPTGVGVAERLSRERRAGVHQGDPLGPLFFALALVVILKSIDTDALELNACYLDNGTDGATTLAIRVNSLAQVAPNTITLNFSKCEIVCADADVALFRNEFPESTSIVPVSSFFLPPRNPARFRRSRARKS